jgi:hypothetical protein
VDGVIPRAGLSLLVGEPASFKSFLALDIALSVSSGTPWQGRTTASGAVFFITGEGRHAFSRRIKAWCDAHAGAAISGKFFLSQTAIDLRVCDSETLGAMIENLALNSLAMPALIVIDTFARNFGDGEENSAGDVGQFIATVDDLRRRFNCAIIVVHHTGHSNLRRARGSSSLPAAADTVIVCDRKPKEQVVTIRCTKMKETEEFGPIRLQAVPIRICEEKRTGAPETSLTLVELKAQDRCERDPKDAARLLGGRNQAVAFQALVDLSELRSLARNEESPWIKKKTWVAKAGLDRFRMREVCAAFVDRGLVEVALSGDLVRLTPLGATHGAKCAK